MIDAGLRGKTAVITGAGNRSGIGSAIAGRLAACGANSSSISKSTGLIETA